MSAQASVTKTKKEISESHFEGLHFVTLFIKPFLNIGFCNTGGVANQVRVHGDYCADHPEAYALHCSY